MKNVIEYLEKVNRRVIVPIGEGQKDLDFLCLGDITFAKAMGFKTFMVGKSLEKVLEGQMLDRSQFELMKENKYFDYTCFSKEIENLIRIKKESNIPIGGGCFGPLTIAGDIIGVENCNRMAIKDPELLVDIVEYISQYIVELAIEEERAGADFFWIAEPLASLFSPDKFEIFSGRFLKRIFNSVSIAGFLHVCGKTLKHTDKLVETGAKVLSIDYLTDIVKCIERVPKNVVIMGNINPMLLLQGTKEEIINEVEQLNYSMRQYKNFIFSSGCLIPSNTPKENIEIMIKTTLEFKMED